MEKLLFIVSIGLLMSSISNADESCKKKVVIAAQVTEVKKFGFFFCVAQVDLNSISRYETNPACPVKKEELQKGIQIPYVGGEGDKCFVNEGEILSGEVVVTNSGSLRLMSVQN